MKFGPISNSGFAQIEVNKSTTLFPQEKKNSTVGFWQSFELCHTQPLAPLSQS